MQNTIYCRNQDVIEQRFSVLNFTFCTKNSPTDDVFKQNYMQRFTCNKSETAVSYLSPHAAIPRKYNGRFCQRFTYNYNYPDYSNG